MLKILIRVCGLLPLVFIAPIPIGFEMGADGFWQALAFGLVFWLVFGPVVSVIVFWAWLITGDFDDTA